MSILMRRKRNQDGTLGILEKIFEGETYNEKVTRLEGENSMLLLEIAMSNKANEDLNDIVSELIFNIAIGGML